MPHARALLSSLLLAALPALAATGPLAPELKVLWTLEACYQQEQGHFTTDLQAIGLAPSKNVGMRVDSLAPDRLVGLAWHDGMLRALDLNTGNIGPLGWADTAAIPALRQILSNPAAIPVQDTLLAGMRLHLWSRTAGDTLWNLALDTASLQAFALRRIGTKWSTLGLDTLGYETYAPPAGPLAPELRQLWTLETSYQQEQGRFSRLPAAIGMPTVSGQGFLIDSIAPAFWSGLAWKDGLLRALGMNTGSIGPLGWEESAAIPALRQILSNPAVIPVQDTLLAGMRLHLWSRTAGDTLWNLALDTAGLHVFALRRIGTRWSTLGLDTLPRERLVATRVLADARVGLTESETWLQEQGTYPASLSLDSARAALPLVRLWQTSAVRDSALLLVLDPQDASLGAWSSRTGLRGQSSLDRSVYAPAIRALFGEILARKILPPATGSGWLSETDTLRSGDSSIVLELRSFRHGDTTLVTALESSGVSAFCRLQVPAGFLDFGFAPASVGVRASRHTATVRKPLRTDILGRPREGARLGTTTLRVRR